MSRLDALMQQYCPNGVEFKKIKDVFTRLKGTPITAGKMKQIENSDGEIRIFAGGKTVINATESDIPNANITRVPAVLVQSRGVIDFVYYDKPFTFKNEMWAYTNDNITTVKYLYYCLKNNLERFRAAAADKGSMPQISLPITEEFQIPVPPLPVQEEIVRILDMFTELEAELAQELAHRKLQYTFYRDKLLSFDNPIVTKAIGEICAIKRGKVISKDYIRAHGGVYPVYSSQTENDGVLGLIDSYDYDGEYLTWTTDGANAGTVFHRTGKFNITNVCGLLKPIDANVNVRYLYYILGDVACKYVEKGMGNPKLMSNVMEKIKVPVPSLDIQKRLVEVLDNFDAICSSLSIGLPAEIAEREKQYNYYRDVLLNYAATGKLTSAQSVERERERDVFKIIAYVFGPRALS